MDLKQSSTVLLQDLIRTQVLTPLDKALSKAILIQISLPSSLQANQTVQITSEEISALLDVSSLKQQSFFTAAQVLAWLKCLALHPVNKQALLDHDILTFLAPLVDETETQQAAAELLYSFMNCEESAVQVAACSNLSGKLEFKAEFFIYEVLIL